MYLPNAIVETLYFGNIYSVQNKMLQQYLIYNNAQNTVVETVDTLHIFMLTHSQIYPLAVG